MEKKFELNKNTKAVIALVLVAIISIGLSFVTSKPEMYKPVYEVLDEKRADALALSAGALTLSTGISIIAENKLDPVIKLLSDVTSYVTLAVSVIFLEKLLLTSFGFLTFAIIIPFSCLLGLLYIWLKKDLLKTLAIKLTAFGLVLFLLVPSSVVITSLIEKSKFYEDVNIEVDTVIEDEELGSFEKVKKITKEIKIWIEQKANALIDAIAIMIITTCAIPLGTLALLFWIVKMLFGINVKIPKPPKVNLTQKVIAKKDNVQEISKLPEQNN